jgi:hypothetical protein
MENHPWSEDALVGPTASEPFLSYSFKAARFPLQRSGLDWSSTAHVERPPFHRERSVNKETNQAAYSSLSPSTTGCLAAQRAGK